MAADRLGRVLAARRVEALDGRWLRVVTASGPVQEREFDAIAADGGWDPGVEVAADVPLPAPVIVPVGDALVRVRVRRDRHGRLRVSTQALPPHAEAEH